ncbi:unnamed protein product [Spirodela intermedia]|uniref:Uncharacterized protein n=2 Tax=Spirodela intermedia TaxID=51605 RepID=A0A7I8KNL5_SPIIN|nr:unnamed protein product [Spirodela intermedia]CAA6662983.1 unnamed protein product [Spirodela intermedia]CAA7399409.1 unnamed protein product [Spirodela intermedia]
MKGPGLFSDIGKKGRDILDKDYSYDQKLRLFTRSAAGLGLTANSVKKGGLYSSDITAQYRYKNTTVEVKVDTESTVSSTITLSEILPFTRAVTTFRLPDYNSGKVEVQYFHDHAGMAGAVALRASPTVDLSGTVGSHGIVFGAEAGFDTTSGTLTKYNAGLSLQKPDYIFSLTLGEKGDTLRASYVHHLDDQHASAAVAEVTRRFSTNKNALTVGGLYELDPSTRVKAKLNDGGKLAALLQHRLRPGGSVLTISGELDTKFLNKNPTIGLSLALEP